MLVDELATIKLLSTREQWDRYGRRVPLRALSDNTAKLITDLGAYYVEHPDVTEVSLDAFGAWLKHDRHPNAPPAEKELLAAMVARIKGHRPDDAVTSALLGAWAKAGFLQDAAEELMRQRTGQGTEAPDKALANIIDQYRRMVGTRCDDDGGMSIRLTADAVAGDVVKASAAGFEWRLEDLNVGLGPARPGDFFVLGARPEIGKTSFVLSETEHMLRGGKGVILWINNEELGQRILQRHLSVATGRSGKDVVSDVAGSIAAAEKLGWTADRFRIFDAHSAELGAIEDEIERVDPTIVVLNRLDKMPRVRKASNEVNAFADLAFWARGVAAKGRIVFGIVQADASAEGQKFVYGHQLYGSKTALQGEADATITLGAEHVFDETRGIHIPKNKLTGGPRSSETKRHGFFEVKFDSTTGRFETIVYKTSTGVTK